ncbi:MAG TPA: SBBP repeat-containing protein [Bryobacteraceae bacterium]|nr:SBBP repeat-containing protein [Bryobacteraceae bacterium]
MAGTAVVDAATAQSTALVVKLNPQASQYLYVRYLGGTVNDSANAIAVDDASNVYVAGSTRSPDFPITRGGNLGTPPTGVPSLGVPDQRSFVVKLDANGAVVFSDLIGGSAVSSAQAIAVNGSGQILITGSISAASALPFPVTAGAYNIANSAGHPYLLELDSTGTKNIFAATGIGGSAIALDPSGNIYVAVRHICLTIPPRPKPFSPRFRSSASVQALPVVLARRTRGPINT